MKCVGFRIAGKKMKKDLQAARKNQEIEHGNFFPFSLNTIYICSKMFGKNNLDN